MTRVTKILETTISTGGTTATFTDSDIPNSLIRVYSTDSNIYPQTMSLSGNTLTVTYEAVTSTLGVALELVKQGLVINDTLTSTATDEALSANQGKALKDIIDNLGVPALTDLTDVDFVSLADGDIIVYDSINEKFVNQTMPSIPSDITDLDDVNITSIQDGQVLAWNDTAQKFINVNQSGDSSDNYSTTETAIGKWIDNTTIYRCVFDLTSDVNVSNNAWYASGINIANLSKIFRCFGVNSSGTYYELMAYHTSGAVNLLACRDGAVANVRYICIDYNKTS